MKSVIIEKIKWECFLVFLCTSLDAVAAAPPLSHPYLNTNIPVPSRVYRVDSRSPDAVFNFGFTSRGLDADITAHVIGGSMLVNSRYVSTTDSFETAMAIASSQINDTFRNTWSCSSQGDRLCRTWIYTITPRSSNFFSISQNLPENDFYARYILQHEWAAVDRIAPQLIESAVLVTRRFVNGVPAGPAVFATGGTRQNYLFNQYFEGYSPAGFSAQSVGSTRVSLSGCGVWDCHPR
ncbi:hypothetical protein [Dyella acidiphila]|uniref:Uncharacterized protein n=1 Tax=Dyella acidiphila TaxID=2775866 RepID=A0ABR9G9Q7_9GAMM|nr:hypothetical protein [Dyella acidiphila]MBE1160784.1 hypothetical protein [Dyella acidiphila]